MSSCVPSNLVRCPFSAFSFKKITSKLWNDDVGRLLCVSACLHRAHIHAASMRCGKQVEAVLVVRRKDNGKLACIGGFVEVGETLAEATRREVMEETGLDVTSLQMLPRVRKVVWYTLCNSSKAASRYVPLYQSCLGQESAKFVGGF